MFETSVGNLGTLTDTRKKLWATYKASNTQRLTVPAFNLCHPQHIRPRDAAVKMGTGKKEAARKERQGKVGDGMSNVKTKGENFYRYETQLLLILSSTRLRSL